LSTAKSDNFSVVSDGLSLAQKLPYWFVMKIRPFEPADAPALASLFHASVREAAAKDYSADQIAAWSPSPPESARYVRQAEGRIFLVAENDAGEPVGYADLELDGHIDHLYCRPDVVGSGVGSALYAALEARARERGMPFLFVEASDAARRLFERHGFKIESRNDFKIAGVPIHNYRMSKAI
jgi:putative acetyltransferase